MIASRWNVTRTAGNGKARLRVTWLGTNTLPAIPWKAFTGSLGSSACRPLVEGSRADEVRGDGQVAAGVGKNVGDWLGLPLPPSGRSSVQCKCAVQHQMAGTQTVPALSQLPGQSELDQSDQARAKAFRVGARHKQVCR